MNIKYRQLKAFTLAARSNSFRVAAESLAVTQPSFSNLIRELETDIGVQLFERTTRSVRLTPAGEAFLRDVEPALEELESAYQRIDEVGKGTRGRLAVAALASASLGILTRAIAGFSRAYPGVRVSLSERKNDKVFDAVRDKEVELGFACRWQEEPELEFEPLFTDRLMVVTMADHALAGARPGWKAIGQYPLIIMGAGMAEHALRFNNVARKPAYEVEHMATALSMVRQGIGITLVPSTVLDELNMSDLVATHIRGPLTVRQLGVAYRGHQPLSAAARTFIEFVRQEI